MVRPHKKYGNLIWYLYKEAIDGSLARSEGYQTVKRGQRYIYIYEMCSKVAVPEVTLIEGEKVGWEETWLSTHGPVTEMVSDSLLCALQRSGKQFRHFLLWSMVKRITDVTRTPWRSRGVDYYMPTRQWRVEMTSGVFGFISRAQLALSLIHIWRCRRDVLCRSRWSPYH